MAAENQSFMFGDFDDLTPDEHQRVHHILHGYKEPSEKRVEFPWDDSILEGAMAGPGVYFGTQDIVDFDAGYAEMGPYSVNVSTEEQDVQINPYQGEYSFMKSDTETMIENEQTVNQIDEQSIGVSFGTPDITQNPSKLQASLKKGERRNKKKRPPGYYSQTGNEAAFSDNGHMSLNDGTQVVVRSEVHVNLSNQPEGAYYSENRQENIVETNFKMKEPSGVQHMSPAYQNSPSDQYMQDAPNSAMHPNIEAQYSGTKAGELNEIVVESVPYSDAHIQQKMDIKQIQDHDRTTNVSDSVAYSNSFTHSNIVSSDNDVFVSKLQIPNIGAPNKMDVLDNENVANTDSSQVPTNFQSSNQIAENVTPNELSSDTQQPSSDSILTNSNVMQNDSKSEVEASISVDTSLTTAMADANKTDIISPPIVGVESPKSVPQPAKPTSWAGLFKSKSASSYNSYNPMPSVPAVEGVKDDNSSDIKDMEEQNEREISPMPVPAAEDKEAKTLGELLSKMTIIHTSVALQPRGLVNRANWCYINGTLQALVACPPFYNMLKKLPLYPALSRGPTSTPILDSLVEFVHEFHPMPRSIERGPKKVMRDLNPGTPFEPCNVYRMLQAVQVNPHFKHGKQEDAEEFLSCILDGMHEEMSAAVTLINKNEKSGAIEDGYTNGYAAGETDEDEEMVTDAWEQVGPKKKSVQTRRQAMQTDEIPHVVSFHWGPLGLQIFHIYNTRHKWNNIQAEFAKTPIAEIFAGMIRSVVYKASAKETATLQPFFTLQLDIQSDKVWTVKDALEGFMSKEQISGYNCPKTNAEVEVVKKSSIEELPPVLILHLKFFVFNKDGGSQKLMKKVDYPVELEITKDLLSPNARSKLNQQQRSYKLFAVVYHHGKTSTGGHYTTSMFHPGINGWVHSDDSTVKTVLVRDVLRYVPQRVPYLLYYRRLDSH